jgi:hypothetical protein
MNSIYNQDQLLKLIVEDYTSHKDEYDNQMLNHILMMLRVELYVMVLETNNQLDLNMHLEDDDKDVLDMLIENDDNPLVNNVEYEKKMHVNVVGLPYYLKGNMRILFFYLLTLT